MAYDLNLIRALADDVFDETMKIRRRLHRHPELSGQEEETARLVCAQLEALGIPYTPGIAGHSVCGLIRGADQTRAAAIRADMDALPIEEKNSLPFRSQNPGVMHACGHDMHSAILLGSAKVLRKLQAELPFCVKLFFQAAEETTGGARQMIEAGCLQDPVVEYVIGLHVEPALESGCVQFTPGAAKAASCEFAVTVKGRSCHGAHPQDGLDPLLPACKMVLALQTVAGRRPIATDGALITVGQLHSGTKNNIIPAESSFSGIIRTLHGEQRAFLKEQIKAVCRDIAADAGAACAFSFADSYPVLVNDEHLLAVVRRAAAEALGPNKIKISHTASMGCDDFAYFCHGARSLYYDLGVARPGQTDAAPVHSEQFCPDEEAIRTGILTEVTGILRIMEEMRSQGKKRW